MVKWGRIFNISDERNRHRWAEEARRLLPNTGSDLPPSAIPAKDVTKVALRLKYQIEQVIPIELEETKVTKANSPVITDQVVKTAKAAGGDEHKACVVYCLLVVKRWFKQQAMLELWDSDLHDVRAVACEFIAKRIIEEEEDQNFLLQKLLLERFSIVRNNQETEPANVIERAVDMHALTVIGSSGYQKAVKYLWNGWIVQNDMDAGHFIEYKNRDNDDYWSHFDADRMRTPRYQNAVQIFFSLLYLILYTECINTVNEDGDLDIVEGIVYIMTVGFVFDELSKFWKVGRYYFGFWNAFNGTLYALLGTSFVIRMLALSKSESNANEERAQLNKLGYHFFAFSAPMFWMRMLLYLDTFRFFGAMLVVLKVMMRESLIFFALLIVVCIGFLQAFIGLNQTEGNESISNFIVESMIKAVLTSPEFEGFDDYAHPFGLILYYIFSFVVMVILLNILIALYNSAYEDITENAIDEYMALFAQKTMRFVRAPDENVFIAPLNLIEIFGLIIPFEWWLPDHQYERLNHYVMTIIYSPMLLISAAYESYEAKTVRSNRKRGEEDDDTIEEWEQMDGELDFEGDGWAKTVERTKPNVTVDSDILAIRELQKEIQDLRDMVKRMGSVETNGHAGANDSGLGSTADVREL